MPNLRSRVKVGWLKYLDTLTGCKRQQSPVKTQFVRTKDQCRQSPSQWANGNVYEGEYKAGEKEGRGVFRYADGTVDSCLYKPGTWSREGVGWAAFSRRRFYQEGVRWEADGRRAARLHDEEEEEISLEEARQTAERLGLPIPSPLPSASEGEERI